MIVSKFLIGLDGRNHPSDKNHFVPQHLSVNEISFRPIKIGTRNLNQDYQPCSNLLMELNDLVGCQPTDGCFVEDIDEVGFQPSCIFGE